jgi:hypothetical protein
MSEHSLNTGSAEVSQTPVWQLPEGARVPEGATFYLGEDDTCCRLIHLDGRRCLGVRIRETGLCPPHSGRSKVLEDPRGMQARSAGARLRARERRSVLATHGMNPRRAAREAAIAQSQAIVEALVDAPLRDPSLSTMQRQRATLAMLDAVFPLAQVTAEIELPATTEGVQSLSWSDMQRIAGQLLAGDQAT